MDTGNIMLLNTAFIILLIWVRESLGSSSLQEERMIYFTSHEGGEISKFDKKEIFSKETKSNCSDAECVFEQDNERLEIRELIGCSYSNFSGGVGGPDNSIGIDMIYMEGYLYGGSEQFRQYWPLDDVVLANYPYTVKHQDNQGIAERYWLTSKGRYIYEGPVSQLFVYMNNYTLFDFGLIKLGLYAKNIPPYLPNKILMLNTTDCSFPNARKAHMHAVENLFQKPKGLPDKRMIRYPIWSTGGRYKKNINEKFVLEFANEIISNGFKYSQLQIDDSWEHCYGSLTFDKNRFPDMKALSKKLKGLGFTVAAWVHPFINTDCDPYYTEALEKGYFVKNEEGVTQTTWWNGEAGVIDFTNEDAARWWTQRIRTMQNENGVDSLKFDAGESSWLPQLPTLTGDVYLQPNIYTQKYVQTAATFGNMGVVRVGFQTQDLPVFVRMQDKDSRWGFDNGLRTLVTTLFQMNMAGYPFVLPDKVGGNGVAGPPSKELYIRWLQATVFMPAIQFSYAPWDYDSETIAIAKQYTELHDKMSHMIVRAMEEAQESGAPVNFPIWWISPEDETAQPINDQYLLGEDIIVAPVLEEGSSTRDIYLPEGKWVDILQDWRTLEGPMLLKNYRAGLDLPYFVKLESLNLVFGESNRTLYVFLGCGIGLVVLIAAALVLRNRCSAQKGTENETKA